MFWRSTLALVFATALSHLLHSQQYAATQYGIREGLPQSEITAIAEDQLGYLWIGTGSGGVVKFDGNEFISFSTKDGLLSNFVQDIEIDSHNNIWIAHMSGLSKFDGRHFSTSSIPDTTRQFGRIRDIAIDNDTLLVVTGTGYLGKIFNDSVYTWKYHSHIKNQNRIYAIKEGKDHTLFFFFYNGPVIIRQPGKTRMVNVAFKPLMKEAKYTFPQYVVAADGGIVAGSPQELVMIGADGRVHKVSAEIPSMPLYFDSSTDEWWHWSTSSDSVEVSGKRGVFKMPLPRSTKFVFKDSENNFWAATADKGLFKISKRKIYLNESTTGLRVNSILKITNDEYWFGTFGQGLYRLKDNKASLIYLDKKFLRRNNITGLAMSPDEKVWVTTDLGVGLFKTNGDTIRWMSRLNGYPFNPVSHVSFDEAGTPWLATLNNGSVVLRNGKPKLLNTALGRGFTDMVYTSLYSGFYKKMILAYEEMYQLADTTRAITVSIPTLKNSSIVSIDSYQDSLVLIGSNGAGVLIHSPKTGLKANLTKSNGFVSDFVYFVSEDSGGNIWVGTEKGVSRLRLDRNFRIVKHQFYETSETDQDACMLDGKFLFGTIDGMYQFSDDTTTSDVGRDFQLHFTEVEAGGSTMFTNPNPAYPVMDNIRLSHDRSSIHFSFSAIEKSDPDVVRYSFKLENFDSEWSLPSSIKTANYNSLPPGNYLFRAKAIDMITGKEKNEITYAFVVTPPFYKTTSFIFMMTFVFVLFVMSFIWFRIRANISRLVTIEKIRSEQQAMLRKEMAQDFHDEMGNQLARIINFTSQLQLQPVFGENHRTLYKKIEDTAKNLYNGTREFIWSMNPDNEKLHHVFNHIKDFGETLFAESDIRFVTDNRNKSTMSLPFGYAREITLIFKEALTNVFKYSKATEIKLMLSVTPQGFEMTVSDNGVGFALERNSAGNGLSNMQNRANKMKAEFSIYTEPGKGTSISLYLDNTVQPRAFSVERFRADPSRRPNVRQS